MARQFYVHLGGLAVLLVLPYSVAQAAEDCASLLKFAAPIANASIEKAQDVPAGVVNPPPGAPPIPLQVPAHCRVDGIVGAHLGRDGKSYGIRFAVAMPDRWNGRLLYQGGVSNRRGELERERRAVLCGLCHRIRQHEQNCRPPRCT